MAQPHGAPLQFCCQVQDGMQKQANPNIAAVCTGDMPCDQHASVPHLEESDIVVLCILPVHGCTVFIAGILHIATEHQLSGVQGLA